MKKESAFRGDRPPPVSASPDGPAIRGPRAVAAVRPRFFKKGLHHRTYPKAEACPETDLLFARASLGRSSISKNTLLREAISLPKNLGRLT
jgi:hypothetical protein